VSWNYTQHLTDAFNYNSIKSLFSVSINLYKNYTLITKKSFVSVKEDFFLDSVYSENLNILSKRSQEHRKYYNNFLD
jgi:hypothetical protein